MGRRRATARPVPSCQLRPNQCPVAQVTNGTTPKKVTASNQNTTKKAVKSRVKKWSDNSNKKPVSATANTRLMPASVAMRRHGSRNNGLERRGRRGNGTDRSYLGG